MMINDDVIQKVAHALHCADVLIDAVPSRAQGSEDPALTHLGKLVNGPDGIYHTIADAKKELFATLSAPAAQQPLSLTYRALVGDLIHAVHLSLQTGAPIAEADREIALRSIGRIKALVAQSPEAIAAAQQPSETGIHNATAELEGRASTAYCNYIDRLRGEKCLGAEHKLQHGKFGTDELEAHCKAREQLGAHRALQDAANAIRSLLRPAAQEAEKPQEPEANELIDWLETEVSAISCRYRGDPSYDHDAYYMRDQVMKLLREARMAFSQEAAREQPADERKDATRKYQCTPKAGGTSFIIDRAPDSWELRECDIEPLRDDKEER